MENEIKIVQIYFWCVRVLRCWPLRARARACVLTAILASQCATTMCLWAETLFAFAKHQVMGPFGSIGKREDVSSTCKRRYWIMHTYIFSCSRNWSIDRSDECACEQRRLRSPRSSAHTHTCTRIPGTAAATEFFTKMFENKHINFVQPIHNRQHGNGESVTMRKWSQQKPYRLATQCCQWMACDPMGSDVPFVKSLKYVVQCERCERVPTSYDVPFNGSRFFILKLVYRIPCDNISNDIYPFYIYNGGCFCTQQMPKIFSEKHLSFHVASQSCDAHAGCALRIFVLIILWFCSTPAEKDTLFVRNCGRWGSAGIHNAREKLHSLCCVRRAVVLIECI